MDAITDQTNALNYALDLFKDNTEQTVFYICFPNFKVTNGIRHAAERYSLQWFIFIVFTSQSLECFKGAALQVWQLQRIKRDKVMIVAQNELGTVIFTEKCSDVVFTTHDYFKVLWVDGLLLLPSETQGKSL
jgi:hypothetical protein